MAEFRMPSLGADMDEGTLVEWLVEPGSTVHKGDIIAVIDTDKAAVEVECFDSGLVRQLLVRPGEKVPVGTALATIESDGSAQEPATPAPPSPPHPALPEPQWQLAGPPVRKLAKELGVDLLAVSGSGLRGTITHADVRRAAGVGAASVVQEESASTQQRRRPASPYARRLARELGVDAAGLQGSGRDGVVRAADVRAALSKPVAARPETTRLDAMRQATARLMARSKREIPHYYLGTTVDLSQALAWLRTVNQGLPVGERVLPAALVLKACALAARRIPRLNGFWTDDHFVPAPEVHLGVAVSLRGGGLVAPAIMEAAGLGLAELMTRLRDLVLRARKGRLRGSELTSATITVTNLGDLGVESVYGVVYPPQVALVGCGRIVDRPCAVDGLLGVRPTVTLTLSADHRATDGHTGAQFLETVAQLLRQPEEL